MQYLNYFMKITCKSKSESKSESVYTLTQDPANYANTLNTGHDWKKAKK